MKRITVVMTIFLFAVLLLASTAVAQPSPFQSPVSTLELTPPHRSTPTGWPNAPFPTVTPKHKSETTNHVAPIIMASQPTLTPVPQYTVKPAPVKKFAWQYRLPSMWYWKLLGFD